MSSGQVKTCLFAPETEEASRVLLHKYSSGQQRTAFQKVTPAGETAWSARVSLPVTQRVSKHSGWGGCCRVRGQAVSRAAAWQNQAIIHKALSQQACVLQ